MDCIGLAIAYEFCVLCDCDRSYIHGFYCLYCGSNNPFGDYHDDSISDDEINEYIRLFTVPA